MRRFIKPQEISHDAAEQTNDGLTTQNEALASMVTTITQLEASIREIATITNASSEDSLLATRHTEKVSKLSNKTASGWNR